MAPLAATSTATSTATATTEAAASRVVAAKGEGSVGGAEEGRAGHTAREGGKEGKEATGEGAVGKEEKTVRCASGESSIHTHNYAALTRLSF